MASGSIDARMLGIVLTYTISPLTLPLEHQYYTRWFLVAAISAIHLWRCANNMTVNT
jgi:hypothetical protein